MKYRIAAWALFMLNYEDKNLEELEGLKWGAPSFDWSVGIFYVKNGVKESGPHSTIRLVFQAT